MLLEEVKGYRARLDVQNAEIEKLRKEMESIRETQQDVKGEADKVSKDIDKLSQDLSDLFEQKDVKREEYWKARFDFEIQKEEIAHIEWMHRQKERVLNRESEQKQLVEERENFIKSLPHPFEKELDTCEHIVGYLIDMKRKAGLLQDSETVARDTHKNFMSETAKQNLEKKVQEGKIQHAMSKHEREEEGMIKIGGGKKAAKPKKEKKDPQENYEFNIDIMVIKKFGLIQVSPPISLDDIDNKIAEINKKKVWYTDNGETKLKETIEELRKLNDQQLKEETKQQTEVDDGVVFESRGRGRGARGGRSRGGYGDAEGNRGRGRGGRGGRHEFRVRNEFEGESDEDYQPSHAKT